MKKEHGFSLMELMIVMVIIAILASFAIPTYFDQIRKGARSDALGSLIALQMKQEIWRADNSAYTNVLSNLGWGSTTPGGDYTLSVPIAGTYAYTLRATALGEQTNDTAQGLSCATLEIDQGNGRTPSECWQQ